MPHDPGTIVETWKPIVWAALAIVGVLGVLALVSPKLFSAISQQCGRWVDTSQALATLDKRIEIDSKVLPYSRWLGAAVLGSVAILAVTLMRL